MSLAIFRRRGAHAGDSAEWDFAAAARMGAGELHHETPAWYGWDDTLDDIRQPMARRYVPGPLDEPGRLSPGAASIQADLGGLVLFRDTARAVYVRSEPHHCGQRYAGGPWPERYAAIWQHRAGALDAPVPDYGIAAMARSALIDLEAGYLEARREVMGDADVAQAHSDSGFRAALRVFHSEAEVMTGVPA